ncbi:hypothetical protein [Methanobrevibacter sp.]
MNFKMIIVISLLFILSLTAVSATDLNNTQETDLSLVNQIL